MPNTNTQTMPHLETTVGGRYILHQKLSAGGMGTVYRATDRLTCETVALKQVKVPFDQFGPSGPPTSYLEKSDGFRLALVQEFKVLASLRHPHIITVLDYGFDANRQPYFTMQLLEDAPNIIQAGQGQTPQRQVELLVQMLQALAYLHRRGIIHRDLKPDNVLVVNDQVKVLDFGVAIAREQLTESDGTILGTPAYIAPEILEGQPATEVSDLYAAGMMAYEMFAGEHPFDTTDIGGLLMNVVHTSPDVEALPIDSPLKRVIKKSLVKAPTGRYNSANALITAIAEATRRDDLLIETRAVRESFLQAAKFVGRQAELGQLVLALNKAVLGHGSAWLIGGESGVGKSRLLEELRTQALVEGALVLRGQAINKGAAPYQSWRDALRRLCLESKLSGSEAAILQALVTDIETLLGHKIPTAPELDPQTTHERLLNVVGEAFSRHVRPVVVILEDIHWANAESLELLDHLSKLAKETSLLLVASYRDEERPNLPDLLPEMLLQKLTRLSEDGIAALSESMLGEIGKQADVLELIQQETEGNTFFIVEVVRALAEEAGQLDMIGSVNLPRSVFAGGMQEVVQRRLSHVPTPVYDLLNTAAVLGREVNLDVFNTLHPEVNTANWLNACADASVLEVENRCWRFSHDKLREQLLIDMPADRQVELHTSVAQAIERVYPDNDDYASALAYHWREAGQIEKTVYYLYRAGQQTARTSAYQEATHFFEQALELLDTLPNTPEYTQQELDLQIALGSMLIAVKGYAAPEVAQVYDRARLLCQQMGQTPHLFQVIWGLSSYYTIKAEFEVAHQLAQQLLVLAQQQQEPLLLVEAYRMLGSTLIFSGQVEQAVQYVAQGYKLYKPKLHKEHVQFYATDPGVVCLCYWAWGLWLQGHLDQARQKLADALELAQSLSHPHTTVLVNTIAAFLNFQFGDTSVSQQHLDVALPLAAEHGFSYWLAQNEIQQGVVWVEQGNLTQGVDTLRRGIENYQATGSDIGRPDFLSFLAAAYGKCGHPEQALELMSQVVELVDNDKDLYTKGELYRTKGNVLRQTATGSDIQIEACYRQALELANDHNLKIFQLRAAVSLGHLWQEQGNFEQARQLLNEIYSTFTEGFDTKDLQEAGILLQNL